MVIFQTPHVKREENKCRKEAALQEELDVLKEKTPLTLATSVLTTAKI